MPFTDKFLTVPATIKAGGRDVKRYYISSDPEIEEGVRKAALDFLPRLLPAPDEDTPPASFVIVHRGGGTAAYVNAYSWVWGNVLECHVAAAGVPFLGCPDEDPENFTELTRPWIGCVW